MVILVSLVRAQLFRFLYSSSFCQCWPRGQSFCELYTLPSGQEHSPAHVGYLHPRLCPLNPLRHLGFFRKCYLEHLILVLESGWSILESCVVHQVLRLTWSSLLSFFILFLTIIEWIGDFWKQFRWKQPNEKKKLNMPEPGFEQQMKKRAVALADVVD